MNIPTYTNTNLVINYLIKIEKAIQTINRTPIPYIHKEELLNEMYAEDIIAIAELINEELGYDEAKRVQEGKVLSSARSKLLPYINYRNGMDFVRSYTPQSFMQPSVDLLLHINKIQMNKLVEEWEAGKLRDFSDQPNELYDSWYALRDFYPNLDFANHFNEIINWIYARGNNFHKLIQIAILLYELIDKAPLLSGNQLSSTLLLSTLTKDLKYNPDSMLSIAKALNFIGEDLKSAFKISRSNRDLTVFIEAFLYTMSNEYLSLEQRYLNVYERKVKLHGKLSEKLNNRQKKLLDYMENNEKVTRSEVRKLMGVSFMTAYRDLQQLVEEGYIEIKGVGRGTYYKLLKKDSADHSKPELQVFGSHS
ncbi:MAG: DeoR family transcriptional regulator [Candidatus Dojkabacteria bacterium]|nr:MAG: DeoR family transcriptional regulator [Candidatus Dojkabacteria bacterium]